MSGTLGGILLTVLFIALGIAVIHNFYLRSEVTKMNRRMQAFLRPGFKQWSVDKQVITKAQSDPDSLDLVVYDPTATRLMDLSLPRMIRVNISNGSQIKHIADVDMYEEDAVHRAIAEDRCHFLNANEIK